MLFTENFGFLKQIEALVFLSLPQKVFIKT